MPANANPPRLFLSAGEASGENYGAMVLRVLRAQHPELEAFGLGGEKMEAAGFRCVVRSSSVAVVGLSEVVKHLPDIYREFRRLLRAIDEHPPQAAVLVDFPDFNFRLARELHKRGIPVIYFVSPQLWAWRPRRIRLVRKYVSRMLVIFPFEQEFYRSHGVEAEYVGHPLAQEPPLATTREIYAAANRLDASRPWIALLPGSRPREIEMNLPEMVRAAQMLGPDYDFLVPAAPNLGGEARRWLESHIPVIGPRIHVVEDARVALTFARASVVASGTATVEAALAGNPFVVVYRVSSLTYALGRRLVAVEHFAMPNLIAGRQVVPELIQQHYSAQNVVEALQPLLPEGSARSRMMADLADVRRRLSAAPAGSEPSSGSPDVASRVAAHVWQFMQRDTSSSSAGSTL